MPRLRAGRLMPHAYAVARRRLTVRARPDAHARVVRHLGRGSGIVLRPRTPGPGGPWRRSRLGYVRARDLRFVRPSRLHGVVLGAKQRLPVSWISGATAWVYRRPRLSKRGRRGGLRAYTRVTVHEIRRVGGRRFARIGPDRWVRAKRVRTARRRRPPPGVGPKERWIHVHLKRWTLVAYEGARPVYAALISRGFNTPRGLFRVTRKVPQASLRLFLNRGGRVQVELEAVPWVVYFRPRIAFHSAYWHDLFGARASRGCINLSPVDARWLFQFTTPRLRPGWYEARPGPKEPGTRVLVE